MRYFLYIFSVLLVFGCVRSNRIPNDIISQNEMRNIMWDLMRADAFVTDFVMKDSTRDRKIESVTLYQKVFAIHSTTEENFKRSLSFYESRPDLLKVITDSLRSDEKRVQSYEEYKNPHPIDSTLQKPVRDKKLIKNKQ